tara:strand:+ start:1213 stop:1995 length:783 start_codon:yes stop_codon:yes gene_type:complete
MPRICFDIVSLFPNFFDSLNDMGVISRAIKENLITVNIHNLRNYGEGTYKRVDDIPYGGGSGMVLKPEPIYNAFKSIKKSEKKLTLLMSPQGNVLKQNDFARWLSYDQLIIICGQYEGFDERVRQLADEEISIGDYILTGGEIPAISIINGLTRLIPGSLGDPNSLKDESHNSCFLEYPQYTRPAIFKGMNVPEILLSGNHKKIKSWRDQQMIKRTFKRRKDLIFSDLNKNMPFIKNEDETLRKVKGFKFYSEFYHYPDW